MEEAVRGLVLDLGNVGCDQGAGQGVHSDTFIGRVQGEAMIMNVIF